MHSKGSVYHKISFQDTNHTNNSLLDDISVTNKQYKTDLVVALQKVPSIYSQLFLDHVYRMMIQQLHHRAFPKQSSYKTYKLFNRLQFHKPQAMLYFTVILSGIFHLQVFVSAHAGK